MNFNKALTGGVSSNFATAAGVAKVGLYWGVIVDNSGDGFLTSYGDVSLVQGARLDLLTSSGGVTDDVLIFSDDFTIDTSAVPDAGGGTGDLGGLTLISNLSLSGGVDAGDDFRVVWFDDLDTTSAGIFSDPSFVLPSDGSTSSFDVPFLGPDPIRSAVGLTFETVPESSSIALLGLGLVGFTLRRRR